MQKLLRHILLLGITAFLFLSGWSLVGCAYYNYLYDAKRSYTDAERQLREGKEQGQSDSKKGLSAYDKCIEAGGRMLQYYPGSRWEPEALLLLAKAYYRTAKYRNSIGKVDELAAKYPNSKLLTEATMWKGMSLLKIAQPDSALLILSDLFTEETPLEFSGQAHFALAEYHFETDQKGAALEQYRQVASGGTEDEWLMGQAWIKIGVCLTELGQTSEAVALYDEVLVKHPVHLVRLEATIQKGRALRELGNYELALTTFEFLLDDAAYLDDFPRLDLEAAITLRAMGRFDEARKRLERLLDTEKKGDLTPRVQYELGSLLWSQWHDFTGARTALKEAAKTGKSADLGSQPDSLLKLIERTFALHQRLEFLQTQILLVDSALSGQRKLLAADTVFVDSLFLITAGEKKSDAGRGRDRLKPKLQKKSENPATGDSAAVAKDSSSTPLDSSGLSRLLQRRRVEYSRAALGLAEFNLFSRNDIDSAGRYYRLARDSALTDSLWGRAVAALAYIARVGGDSTASDSLYRAILDRNPDEELARGVKQQLGTEVENLKPDSISLLIQSAENVWLKDGNANRARELYIQAAGWADSSSNQRARALLAAAYLSQRVLREDSLARIFYVQVESGFKNSAYARVAQRRINPEQPDLAASGGRIKPRVYQAQSQEEFELGVEPPFGDSTGKQERVYEADDVDEPPQLVTTPNQITNLVRSNYPFQAFDDALNCKVLLKLVVGASGEITQPEIESIDTTGLGFEDAAMLVLKKLRYRPGRIQGRPVTVRIKQEIDFNSDAMKSGGGSRGGSSGGSSGIPQP